MTELLKQAKNSLLECRYTCVIADNKSTYTSTLRGVAPILELIDSGRSLEGYCAADKVVGAGAAYLYVLLGISEIWAQTISEAACSVLDRYAVTYFYDNCVPHIINRTGDGICPMESAVANVQSAEEALECIRTAISKLKSKKA